MTIAFISPKSDLTFVKTDLSFDIGLMIFSMFVRYCPREYISSWSSITPESIFETSRTSLMSESRKVPEVLIFEMSSASFSCESISWAAKSVRFNIAAIGVLIS